jgi:hypothetical protein
MREVSQAGEGASTVKWGYGLRAAPGALRQQAAHLRRIAAAAVDDHPMNATLRDSLVRSARRLEAVAEAADAWFPMVRNGDNAPDFDAYETPRDGSVHKESKADTGRAHDGD